MVDVRVEGPAVERGEEILTPEALAFVADLQTRFGAHRDALLAARARPAGRDRRGARPDRLPARRPAAVREGDWRVPPPPPGLVDRRVEITGPTEPKMAINALNCGANVWLADLEDANTPHWRNVVGGQVVLKRRRPPDAVVHQSRTAGVPPPGGRRPAHDRAPPARLAPARAAPAGRRRSPRSAPWSTPGSTCSTTRRSSSTAAAARTSTCRRWRAHLEARLWALVFDHAEQVLGLPAGSIRATMLIETIPAAFEMEEMLHELGTPRRRAQRRPLGLPVQRHQDLPRRRRRSSCSPTAVRSP